MSLEHAIVKNDFVFKIKRGFSNNTNLKFLAYLYKNDIEELLKSFSKKKKRSLKMV